MKFPLFLLLLPLFFVFHGYVENFHYIRPFDCLPLLGLYLLATLIWFFIFRLFLRDNIKAALMTSFIMAFYFFFGAFHDFFRRHDIFLHRYGITLPLFLLMAAVLFIWLKKKQPAPRVGKFLNYLLLIYMAVDSITLVWNLAFPRDTEKMISTLPNDTFRKCDSCRTPDIYLLLFDEYSSSKTLKDTYCYDNAGLDTFLLRENFHIQPDSRSNYFFTPFSMASILNMSYLSNLKDPQNVSANDYIEMLDPTRPAAVIRFLERQGYAIVNNSPFDLPGHPSTLDQPFIPVKTRLIANRTLFHYLMRDIGWWFITHIKDADVLEEDKAAAVYKGNNTAVGETLEESATAAGTPRFVYMHVFMPHGPFLFDSLGHMRKMSKAAQDYDIANLPSYLNYIPYTNTRVKQVISTIKKNTMGKAVIIFLSDHGYRYPPFFEHNEQVFFNNQNAVYFPDGDYRLLHDSISTVNEFRVIFNKLFDQRLPLLKDSLIYLRDAPGVVGNKK
ncbi:MAG TPA: sulfatase-like hydrolase/transferase [Puia sp.]|nr:sulfatase-like hydrolase/transferase [Puia sp.]